ncbi:MAG: hypothetical protein C0432_02005 [Candidatus Puniceispirillum sp.]|nr:hypothetical protein [Candidatus Pelagibacter sp.]MBA4283049.1 hypothetical protein [Candidatus Puniceispirillum sp.]
MIRKIISSLICLHLTLCCKIFAIEEHQLNTFFEACQLLETSAFLHVRPVRNRYYDSETIGTKINKQIQELSLPENVTPHENYQNLQEYFLNALDCKDGQNIKRILHAITSRNISTKEFLSLNNIQPYLNMLSLYFTELTSWALSEQDINGYYASLQLHINSKDKKSAHAHSFEIFLQQRILNKKFIRRCGKIIDDFVANRTFDKEHISNLLKILNKYDPEALGEEPQFTTNKENPTIDLENEINAKQYFFYKIKFKLIKILDTLENGDA